MRMEPLTRKGPGGGDADLKVGGGDVLDWGCMWIQALWGNWTEIHRGPVLALDSGCYNKRPQTGLLSVVYKQ